MNERLRRRRQQLIENTLAGLREILETELHTELTLAQEVELVRLVFEGQKWVRTNTEKG